MAGMAEDFLHVAGLVQVGVANETMRPFLLVRIENTERRRDMTRLTENAKDKEIAPPVGGSEAFGKFLRTELIPEVKARYRTTDEIATGGESLAGLLSSRRSSSSANCSTLTSRSTRVCGEIMSSC
jgi:hypothetical protein